MKAFHGDPAIKARLIAQLEAHYKADEIIQGTYWAHGKGCAVGCTVHSDNHADYERLYGIPCVLARLEDSIFERLSNKEAKEFPLQFIKAIPVGSDLSFVWPTFAIRLMEDCLQHDKSSGVCTKVKDLYARLIAGRLPAENEWDAARADADAAADAAAYAARAAAADAARAADRAAYAANRAAYAAADPDIVNSQKEQLLLLLASSAQNSTATPAQLSELSKN